ncbi:MAG: arsenite methyltransferase [Candidatus Heimdallarchaeota archaeon]
MEKEKSIDEEKIRMIVREQYGKAANRPRVSSCCGSSADKDVIPSSSCGTESCGGFISIPAEKRDVFLKKYSAQLGYSEDDLKSVPDGSNLALGCGNPTAHASIKEGETILDLGSGGGLDCFIAAKKVGKTGKVIGVDMTSAMIDRARKNAKEGNYDNVEFRLGEIEHLPVADNSVDLIISNCVINLTPNKANVFREAFRVLKPGGRIMVSDIVLLKELPKAVRENVQAYVSCIGGAIMKDKYIAAIENAGFHDVEILEKSNFSTTEFFLNDEDLKEALGDQIENIKKLDQLEIDSTSIKVKAIKPYN